MLEKSKVNFRGIFKGIVFSIVLTAILVVIVELISYFSDISDKLISALLFIVSVSSVLVGAIFVTKSTSENGLMHGGIIGIGYFLVILVASIIAKRSFSMNTNLLTMMIANIAGGMLGGILGINSR